MAYYRDHDLCRIGFLSIMGYSLPDLEFLKDHPYVRGVALQEADKLDISGLRHLPKLEYLLVSESKQPLDLSQFRELTEFRGTWHPKLLITSESRKLRTLALWKYKPKSKDLSELAELPALEDLSIVQSPLTSIRGVGRFRKLKRLELSYLTKLESVAGIEELSGSRLERLECHVCKKIGDHAAARAVPSLRVLRYNDCGEIPDIGFLDDLPNLEDFRFVHTNILDGDLCPLLRLKSAGFFKKKHYSHTPEEVDEILAAN
ncbi:MAG: protein phosphatase 1 regulatory subunit 7 [Phycisphaerales bacterium]|jgi:protein phosphatase 1 regulatory subunit 7